MIENRCSVVIPSAVMFAELDGGKLTFGSRRLNVVNPGVDRQVKHDGNQRPDIRLQGLDLVA